MATILIQALALHAVLEISKKHIVYHHPAHLRCISSEASHYGNVNDFLSP